MGGGGGGGDPQNVGILFVLVGSGGTFKKFFQALKLSPANKMHIFQCVDKILCVEFLKVPIHWKMQLLCNVEISRALSFKSL